QLDIVSYFPLTAGFSMAAIDKASARMLADGMQDIRRPVFVSTLTVDAPAFARRHPDVTADLDQGRILRSVLMKPESQPYVPELHARVEALASR
ncbi:MAG: aspartate aminotransferase family protein, partial [Streptosporangiaceae bacterium]